MSLYRGPFLAGTDIGAGADFEQWCDRERLRIDRFFTRSAAVRCAELARHRQWEECGALAQRWLDCDLASGDAAIYLINAIKAPATHTARVAAVLAYENLAARLQRELDVSPDPAVAALVRDIGTAVAFSPAGEPSAESITLSPIIGRERERRALSDDLALCSAGRGRLTYVCGEPGIGKTLLVESWLEEVLAGRAPVYVMRGRCSERLAGAEAYLPLLDALEDLCSGPDGAHAAAALRRTAPVWWAQLTPVERRNASTSQRRLTRELAAFLHELSRERPLVLFLDDVHWSDAATVDFLAYLATRLPSLRVHIVTTHRDEELRRTGHPFLGLFLDLEARGLARELALPFFSADEVARFARRELPSVTVTSGLAAKLHETTEGSPLFVAEFVRELRARTESGAGAAESLERAANDLAHELPRSVRSVVHRKIERLSADDRRVLIVASVQGVRFDAAVIADVLRVGAGEIEDRLAAIARQSALVRNAIDSHDTLGARYTFVHVLYQNALYATLGPAQRRELSAAVASALVRLADRRILGLDAELALLYAAARDAERAVAHYVLAIEEASRLFAHREVVVLCRRALGLLDALPPSTERSTLAMRLHFTVGISTMIVAGYAAPDAGRAYAAARDIAATFGDIAAVYPVLAGLLGFYVVAGDFAQSAALSERMMRIALTQDRPALQVMSHFADGLLRHVAGDHAGSHDCFERAVALYDPSQHAEHIALYRLDPGVCALAETARTLWLLGKADQALARAREALDVAAALPDPRSRAFVMIFLAIVHQFRREPAEALHWVDRTIALCDEHDIAQERAWVLPIRGWALAGTGRTEEGIALTRAAIDAYREMGAALTASYYYCILAEALIDVGKPREAFAACEEGMTVVRRTGEIAYDAELARLRGVSLIDADAREAEHSLEESLRIARVQRTKYYELRAAVALARLWRLRHRANEAAALLRGVLATITEGVDTADVREARELLTDLCAGGAP
ncbi:MAG TPA: AAA family ATPase [Gemmatimonadaceae bacterium]